MSLLTRLPTNLLSAITRCLSVTSMTKLVKMTGNKRLTQLCCSYGGVAEVHFDRAISATGFCKLLLSPLSALSDFKRLTTISVHIYWFSTFPSQAGAFASALPPTLTDLHFRSSCAFSMWLRPVDDVKDAALPLSLRVQTNMVCISIKAVLPELRKLNLRGSTPRDEWSLPMRRHFLTTLPDSIMFLELGWGYSVTSDYELTTGDSLMRDSLLPRHVTQGSLTTLVCDSLTGPFPISFFVGDASLNKPNEPLAPHLTSLTCGELHYDSSLQQLSTLTSLQTLSFRVSPTAGEKAPALLPLPSSLNSLSLDSSVPVDLTALQMTPFLQHFEYIMPREFVPSVTITYLPPSLQYIGIRARDVEICCSLPSNLTSMTLRMRERLKFKSDDDLLALPNLKILKISQNVIFSSNSAATTLSVPLPSSVTDLTLFDPIPLDAMSLLPTSIGQLRANLLLTSVHRAFLSKIKKLTRAHVSQLVIESLPHLNPKTSHFSFHYDNTLLPALFERPHPELDEIKLNEFSKLNPADAPFDIRAPASVKTLHISRYHSTTDPEQLPPNLELLEVQEFTEQSEENPDKTESDSTLSAPINLPSTLRHLYIGKVKMLNNSIYPRVDTLPALQVLTLHGLKMHAYHILSCLPKTLTTLTLSFSQSYVEWPDLMPRSDFPNLKNLIFRNCDLPICVLTELIPVLETLQLSSRLVVNSDLLPPFPESEICIDPHSIWLHSFKHLLPMRYQGITNAMSSVSLEWNEESLAKLPNSVTSLTLDPIMSHLICARLMPRSGRPHLSPLEIIACTAKRLSTLSALRTLSVRFNRPRDWDEQDREILNDDVTLALLRALPPQLTSLELRIECLVKQLSAEMMAALPRGLQRLEIQTVLNFRQEPMDFPAFAAELPPGLEYFSFSDDNFLNDPKVLELLPKTLTRLDADGNSLATRSPLARKMLLDALPNLQILNTNDFRLVRTPLEPVPM